MPKLRQGELPRWQQEVQRQFTRLQHRSSRSLSLVSDWSILFLVHLQHTGYQPTTMAHYFYALRRFARWCESNRCDRVRHIRREHVVAFLRYRIDECGVASHWIRFERHRLCVFFGFLQAKDVVRRSNPAAGIGFYGRDRRPPREVLSHEECQKLAHAPQKALEKTIVARNGRMPTKEQRVLTARDSAILALMLGSGLRRTEIAELTIDGLDLEQGLLRVRGKGRQRLFRVERDVFLHDSAIDALRSYLGLTGDRTSGPLFLSRVGDPLAPGSVGRIPVLYARIALGRHVCAHLLRHTFATHLIQRGADPHTAQRLMGHKDVVTTLRYYMHLTPKEIREEWRKSCPVQGGAR